MTIAGIYKVLYMYGTVSYAYGTEYMYAQTAPCMYTSIGLYHMFIKLDTLLYILIP